MAEPMYERDGAMTRIGGLLQRVARRDGGVLVLHGAAGIGKTTVLNAARRDAQLAGFSVLTARGAVLEQQFPFGLVHQLFAPARGVVPSADPGQMYAILQQLYWDLVSLADRAPVLLLIDDAQWADQASLRFLHFLQGRLEALGVGVLMATRGSSSQVHPVVFAADAQLYELKGLGSGAATQWLSSALGKKPTSAFADQVVAVTGGNPFLLDELMRQITAESMTPDDQNMERLVALSPAGVAMSVLVRLSGTSPEASVLAGWLAVLETTDVAQLSAISGLTQEQTERSINELIAVDVIQPGHPVQFLHPLIRTAVYSQHGSVGRALQHAVVARTLHEAGAPVDLVAAHVLKATSPTKWAISLLRDAAHTAVAVGAPAVAVDYLRRAVSDFRAGPIDGVQLGQLLLELGRATASVDLNEATGLLEQAFDSTQDPTLRISIRVELSRVQRFSGQALAATEMLLSLRDRTTPDDGAIRSVLDAELFACASVSISAKNRFTTWRARSFPANDQRSTTGRSRIEAASAALDAALDSQPLAVVRDHSTTALDGMATAESPALQGNILSLVGLAALVTDQLDQAAEIFDVLLDHTNVANLADRHADMLAQRASLYLRKGNLTAATSEAQRSLDLAAEAQAGRTLLPRAAATIVTVAAEQGVEPPLSMLTDDIDADSITFRLLVYSRAELLAARGQHQAAAEAFHAYGRVNLELGWAGVVSPWRSQLALSRVAADQRPAGTADLELAEEELALATRAGAVRAIGVATRALGLLTTGPRRLEHLTESATWLRSAPAPIELAWTLADLGREHLHLGQLRDARSQLTAAHQLAGRSAARRLETRVAADLTASGGKPPPTQRLGINALTPAELATAKRAVEGLSNRVIAQRMFVTEKTVEAHLRNAYRKLTITGRAQLSDALSLSEPPADQ